MRRIVRRLALAALLMVLWLGLLLGAAIAGEATAAAEHFTLGTFAVFVLTIIAGVYLIVALVMLARSGRRNTANSSDLVDDIGEAVVFFGLAAWFCGLLVTLQLMSWYKERAGLDFWGALILVIPAFVGIAFASAAVVPIMADRGSPAVPSLPEDDLPQDDTPTGPVDSVP